MKLSITIAAALVAFSALPANAITPLGYCMEERYKDRYSSDPVVQRCAAELGDKLERASKHYQEMLPEFEALLAASDDEFIELFDAFYANWYHGSLQFSTDFIKTNLPELSEILGRLNGDLWERKERISRAIYEEKQAQQRAEWEAGRPERERQERERQERQRQADHSFWTNAGQVVIVRTQRDMQVGLAYGYRIVDKTWENQCSLWGGNCGSWVYTMVK